MTDEHERFRVAQWILERQIGWIATADVKIGAIVAIQTAMAGVLAAAFSAATHRSEWAIICTVTAFVCTISAFICSALGLLPRTVGPDRSLIFFGKICDLRRSDYTAALRAATDTQMLDDCADQIHRNAEVACKKHGWVKSLKFRHTRAPLAGFSRRRAMAFKTMAFPSADRRWARRLNTANADPDRGEASRIDRTSSRRRRAREVR